MKKIYDISMPLRPEMLTWPGEPGPSRRVNSTVPDDGSETSTITIGSHTGTHIDAPRHFVTDMEDGIDTLPIKHLTGPCHVFELNALLDPEGLTISAEDLKQLDIKYPKVIFKTSNTDRKLLDNPEFQVDYVCLDTSAAEYLVSKNVHLVGVDYLSVERKGSPGHPVHVELLKSRVAIIEGLYLHDVPAGDYKITALPINLVGSDGAPASVILQ